MTAQQEYEKHKAEYKRLTAEYNRQYHENGVADRNLGSASEQAWILMQEARRQMPRRHAFDRTTNAGLDDLFELNDVLVAFFESRRIVVTAEQIDECVFAIEGLYDFAVEDDEVSA